MSVAQHDDRRLAMWGGVLFVLNGALHVGYSFVAMSRGGLLLLLGPLLPVVALCAVFCAVVLTLKDRSWWPMVLAVLGLNVPLGAMLLLVFRLIL